MVSAISSSTQGNPFSTGQSTAGLEAQLTQCKRQLGDWVNCSSAKTPEGKTKIAEISTRISDLQKRIDETANAKPATRAQSPTSPDIAATQSATPAWATVGTRLDVFA